MATKKISAKKEAEDAAKTEAAIKWIQHKMVDVGHLEFFKALENKEQSAAIFQDMPDAVFETISQYVATIRKVVDAFQAEAERRKSVPKGN